MHHNEHQRFFTENNPHTILGLPDGATRAEITKAYRQLSLKFHPDKSPPDQTELFSEIFKKINAAYAQLTNTQTQHNSPPEVPEIDITKIKLIIDFSIDNDEINFSASIKSTVHDENIRHDHLEVEEASAKLLFAWLHSFADSLKNYPTRYIVSFKSESMSTNMNSDASSFPMACERIISVFELLISSSIKSINTTTAENKINSSLLNMPHAIFKLSNANNYLEYLLQFDYHQCQIHLMNFLASDTMQELKKFEAEKLISLEIAYDDNKKPCRLFLASNELKVTLDLFACQHRAILAKKHDLSYLLPEKQAEIESEKEAVFRTIEAKNSMDEKIDAIMTFNKKWIHQFTTQCFIDEARQHIKIKVSDWLGLTTFSQESKGMLTNPYTLAHEKRLITSENYAETLPEDQRLQLLEKLSAFATPTAITFCEYLNSLTTTHTPAATIDSYNSIGCLKL